jgi:hypothetical protein
MNNSPQQNPTSALLSLVNTNTPHENFILLEMIIAITHTATLDMEQSPERYEKHKNIYESLIHNVNTYLK